MTAQDWKPLPRCCPSHRDFPTLTTHLLHEFRELDRTEVLTQVSSAMSAVSTFCIDSGDLVETAELICRYQLSMLAGRFEDVARLDPQSHVRRSAGRAVRE